MKLVAKPSCHKTWHVTCTNAKSVVSFELQIEHAKLYILKKFNLTKALTKMSTVLVIFEATMGL